MKMKIAISSSMTFAKEILDAKQRLETLGFEVIIPQNTEKFVSGAVTVEDKWEKLEADPFRTYFREIERSDALLVLNYDKNSVKNYIGGNCLIEMGFAHVLDKKIFILNLVPDVPYKDEIAAMWPIVLNGNLDDIRIKILKPWEQEVMQKTCEKFRWEFWKYITVGVYSDPFMYHFDQCEACRLALDEYDKKGEEEFRKMREELEKTWQRLHEILTPKNQEESWLLQLWNKIKNCVR